MAIQKKKAKTSTSSSMKSSKEEPKNSKDLERQNQELQNELTNLRYEMMLKDNGYYRKEELRALWSIEKAIRQHANAIGPVLDALNQSEEESPEESDEEEQEEEEDEQDDDESFI